MEHHWRRLGVVCGHGPVPVGGRSKFGVALSESAVLGPLHATVCTRVCNLDRTGQQGLTHSGTGREKRATVLMC